MDKKNRKKYLVETKAQLKFVGLVIAAFMLLLAFTLWYLKMFLVTILPSGVLFASKERILVFMAVIFAIMLLTAVVIILYTHRFFGPVARMRKELNTMLEHDHYWHLEVRKNDYLKDFLDNVNRLIDKVKK